MKSFSDNILQDIYIRDLKINDAVLIIDLIISEYGENYCDKEFYDINVLKYYLLKISEKKEGIWKGAFFKNQLIGQMFVIIRHNTFFVKLTILKNEFRNRGIINRLGNEMVRSHYDFKNSKIRCCYAFVDRNNQSILYILKKFRFYSVGSTPYHESDKNYIIFARILFDFKQKLISPYSKLIGKIKKTICETNILRSFKIEKSQDMHVLNRNNNDIKIIKLKQNFPFKYQILINNKLCAEFIENEYNKSWYDFQFFYNLTLKSKYSILTTIVDLFKNTKGINALSIPTHVNDNTLQKYLIKENLNYYAFLPFYYGQEDAILLGLSKIKLKKT